MGSGGNVLVLLSEGGEKKSGSNINFLLEEFGVSVNNGKSVTHIRKRHLFAATLSSLTLFSGVGLLRRQKQQLPASLART